MKKNIVILLNQNRGLELEELLEGKTKLMKGESFVGLIPIDRANFFAAESYSTFSWLWEDSYVLNLIEIL